MRNIQLDNNNNLVIEDGVLQISSNLDEYLQAVRNALLTVRGEWFLDRALGTPYYDKIFDKFLERSALRSIFINQIKTVPGTLAVPSIGFELDRKERTLAVSFTVSSIYGDGTLAVDVPI